MAAILLTTKLSRPQARPNLVLRPRLATLWEQAGQRPLTLVCAPAGYGKTTLVVSWLADFSPAQTCWLSLDESDNDGVRFWTYVIAALQTAVPGTGEPSLALLQSPQPPSLAVVLSFLINELAALGDPLFFVIDDYHLIANQAVHESVAYLLDHLPLQVHLILTCRADPPLPLARLRVRAQLLEIREKDLRFTAVEISQFMEQVMGLPLTAVQVQALANRTEGWIAGLQLAGLAATGAASPGDAFATFSGSHHHLVDYLTEEVLAHQSPEVRDFLLQTAVLDRFCAPLCEAILAADSPSPISDLQSLLEQLDRANLFLIPLDNERGWYRYHHLFADLLRLRTGQALGSATLRQIHHRAAIWFAGEQLWAEAIRHALAADDPVLAGELIAQQAATAVAHGELDSLKAWLAALPAAQIRANPQLCLAQAWVDLFLNQTETAVTWLQPVLDQSRGAVVDEALLGEALAVRATLAFMRMEAAQTIADTEQALKLLPETQLSLRTMLSWHLAFTYRTLGETQRSLALYYQAIEMSQRSGNFLLNLSARRELADMLVGQGALNAAQTTLNELLSEAKTRGWMHLWPVAGIYVHLGEIAYEGNALETAVNHWQTAVSHPEASLTGLDAYAQALLAWAYAAQGKHTSAAESMQLAEQGALRTTHPQRRLLTMALISRFWLAQGSVARAAAWLPDNRNIRHDPRYEVYARGQISQAYYLLAADERAQARQIVAALLPAAEASGRIKDAVELWLLLARLAEGAEMATAVPQALALAEPAGLLRTFLDGGQKTAELLAKWQKQAGASTPYLERLLAAATQPVASPANRLLVEPLSERELEVLRLMAEGYSNREIADRLVFTVATAKKHAEHIYGKLGVSSRTQAVARARELNLL